MCPDCKDHCDFAECDECKGTGIDEGATASRREAKAEWDEMKAEERRLEEQMYEPRLRIDSSQTNDKK